MWICPKCGTHVDASFDVCWSCGTTVDGVEDPTFETADEAGPIDDPEPKPASKHDPELELPEPPLDLVEAYRAQSPVEASFLAVLLQGVGIAAMADGLRSSQINLGAPIIMPSRVLVRAVDLPRARLFFEDYERRNAERRGRADES